MTWRLASPRHLERDGWTIVKVCSKQVTRYELYGKGRYWGWRESADDAKQLFEEVKNEPGATD